MELFRKRNINEFASFLFTSEICEKVFHEKLHMIKRVNRGFLRKEAQFYIIYMI